MGEPNNLRLQSSLNGCYFIITPISAGATSFDWEIDNPNIAIAHYGTNSIAIHAADWISLNLREIRVTCRASNRCNSNTFVETTQTFSRPDFPLCLLRVIPQPKLNIFPNPTSAILNLEFENLQALPTAFCVMNMLGIKVLCAENIQLSADNKTNLDLSKLPEGIYILQVVYENGTTTSQKVVVQRGVIAN